MARKVLIGVVLAVMVVNLVIIAVVFSSGSAGTNGPMPNPNGFDDFVKAGQLIASYNSSVSTSNQVGYADTTSRDGLATLIASNQAALNLISEGLSRECRERVEYSTDYSTALMPELASFKGLAWLLYGAGRLAVMEGRTNDAINFQLEGIRLGQEISRGGVMISKLVGIADENIASTPLSNLAASTTDAPRCREIAATLESVDEHEEPPAQTLEQERLWSRKTYGLRGQLEMLLTYKSQNKIKDSFIAKVQRTQRQRRRIIINFAERAYELDKGKLPQTAQDLVPEYLKALPKDPATGKDLGLGQ